MSKFESALRTECLDDSNSEMQRFESRPLGGEVLVQVRIRCRGSNPAASSGQSVSYAYGIGLRSKCREMAVVRRNTEESAEDAQVRVLPPQLDVSICDPLSPRNRASERTSRMSPDWSHGFKIVVTVRDKSPRQIFNDPVISAVQ
jgi:hypothetical protein